MAAPERPHSWCQSSSVGAKSRQSDQKGPCATLSSLSVNALADRPLRSFHRGDDDDDDERKQKGKSPDIHRSGLLPWQHRCQFVAAAAPALVPFIIPVSNLNDTS